MVVLKTVYSVFTVFLKIVVVVSGIKECCCFPLAAALPPTPPTPTHTYTPLESFALSFCRCVMVAPAAAVVVGSSSGYHYSLWLWIEDAHTIIAGIHFTSTHSNWWPVAVASLLRLLLLPLLNIASPPFTCQ